MKIPFWPPFQGYREIDLELSRIKELLKRLGNPEQKLPPTIHIAGTNGKGSTLAYLFHFLKDNNKLVHRYTSPHLVDFNERIILANEEIRDGFLNECLKECKEKSEIKPEITLTFFEGITAAAFLAFSKVKADYLLLETGMGGRLDATNVLDKVLAAIITPISFDHMEFLGDSLDKIAYEKAGIIKENCPVFIGKQEEASLKVIKKKCQEKNSNYYIYNQDFKVQKNEFIGLNHQLPLPKPPLSGSHQIDNMALALAVILKLNLCEKITEITDFNWPARLQKISSNKFKNSEIYVDGGHNISAAYTILEFLKTHKNKKKTIIFSMLKNKNYQEFLKIIAPEINELIATPISNEDNSTNLADIKEVTQSLNIKTKEVDNITEAMKEINEKDELVLVCGSLYLAGEFLSLVK